jgi:hypothetical protein
MEDEAFHWNRRRKLLPDFLLYWKDQVSDKGPWHGDVERAMPSVCLRPPKGKHAISGRDLAGITSATNPCSSGMITDSFHQAGRPVLTHKEMRVFSLKPINFNLFFFVCNLYFILGFMSGFQKVYVRVPEGLCPGFIRFIFHLHINCIGCSKLSVLFQFLFPFSFLFSFFFVLFYLLRFSVSVSRFVVSFDHTERHTTVGRTPLDEGSARRRDLYLTTTHSTHNRETSMPPVGFEPTILASERPKTHALDCTVTGIGTDFILTGGGGKEMFTRTFRQRTDYWT